MKKIIVFAATFFLLLNAKAQDAHFGIKAGLNASSLDYNNNSDMQTKIGFNAGLLAHIHTSSKMWAFQPELYYSSEGAKSKSNSNVSTDLGYLNLPVLVQYMFDNGFRIEAGPQVGFLMNAKTKVGNNSTDIKNNLKSAVFSIPLGLGYVTTNGLGFDARYNFGISNINKSTYGGTVHSNVFQFDVFYQFSSTKK
ncbi:MAG: PorT family protein [Bacteroidota bacterium]|nr:PorT family protein [Bacteroidota bacterium]